MKAETLRKSILQYAIQGKLVPQDPNDEPAGILLKKIKAEKQELIKQGKLKKEKPLPPITEDEIPFEIPDNWEWARLGDIGDWGAGSTPFRAEKSYYDKGTILWIKTGELNENYIYDSEEKITEKAFKECSLRLNKVGDILIAMYGATIGKLAIAGTELTTNQACCACTTYNGFYNLYLFYLLKAIKDKLIDSGEGGAQPNISRIKIRNFVIGLPPFSEQQRIVARIEELMVLVDEYKEKEIELAILEKEFPERLKKSILQYAVQGKLTKQLGTDEPASILLKKIKAEKQELIKQGKIKNEKPLPPIIENETPFEIPDSWEWVRLGELCHKLTDGTHNTPKYTDNGIPFLSVKDMSSGKLDFSNTKFISKDEHEELYKRCNPEKGDLLLTKVGTTGIPVIIDTDIEFSLFVSVALLKFSKKYINLNYICKLISSPVVHGQSQDNTKGVGNKNWVLRDIANTIISLPPLAEQQRIVARIEELFTFVEMLSNAKKVKISEVKAIPIYNNENETLNIPQKLPFDIDSLQWAARQEDGVDEESIADVKKQVQEYYAEKN